MVNEVAIKKKKYCQPKKKVGIVDKSIAASHNCEKLGHFVRECMKPKKEH